MLERMAQQRRVACLVEQGDESSKRGRCRRRATDRLNNAAHYDLIALTECSNVGCTTPTWSVPACVDGEWAAV